MTKDVYLECTAGSHHFLNDKKILFHFRTAEMAAAFEHLANLGYSAALCKQRILDRMPEIRKKLPRYLLRWPVFTARTLAQYGLALLRVHRMGAETRLQRAQPSAEAPRKVGG